MGTRKRTASNALARLGAIAALWALPLGVSGQREASTVNQAQEPNLEPGAAAATPARNHLRLEALDSSPWSTLLTARLADLCDQAKLRLETPESADQIADELVLRLRATVLAENPQWQLEANFQPGAPGLPAVVWRNTRRGWDGLQPLIEGARQQLAQLRGDDNIPPIEWPAPRDPQQIVQQLLQPPSRAAEPGRIVLLADLVEQALRQPSLLQQLFAEGQTRSAKPAATHGLNHEVADSIYLRLRVHPLSLADPNATELLDELLLPRGVEAQLASPQPSSQALLCWALTLPQRARAQADPEAWLRGQLAQELDRPLDPNAQPHWQELRGQLRTGLLLADRLAERESPFCRALRQHLRHSTDGDDLLLTFALALHHLEPVPPALRQQSADALWQARGLWISHPGFRPYLQALAADIASDLTIPAVAELPEDFPQDHIPPQWLLPALIQSGQQADQAE